MIVYLTQTGTGELSVQTPGSDQSSWGRVIPHFPVFQQRRTKWSSGRGWGWGEVPHACSMHPPTPIVP